MNYAVLLNGQAVGSAQVERLGLYYRITCRCQLPDKKLYCLKVKCGEHIRELGVCVPMGKRFGVDTAVPVKQIGEGQLQFYITPKCSLKKEEIYPVREDAPFAHLYALPRARLRTDEDMVGIIITEQK